MPINTVADLQAAFYEEGASLYQIVASGAAGPLLYGRFNGAPGWARRVNLDLAAISRVLGY